MKNLIKGVMEWKTSACFLYTASMAIYLAFCLVFDQREVPVTTLWTLLLACAVGSLLQGICFSSWIIKKMRYTWRSLLFVVLYLPVLSLIAWRSGWFPTDHPGSWGVFIGAFFLIFAVMTIGFDIYFRFTGRKYDGVLGQYRKEKEEKGE